MPSKRQVIRKIEESVGALGYERVPGPISGAAAVFYKVHGDLVLTFGLQFSTRYEDRFTGSFYLSRSFEWGYVPDGFPHEAYQRIGRFLTKEERILLLPSFFSQPGVVDAWWIGFDVATVTSFIEAIRLTEPRFLRQPGLIDAVSRCEAISRHVSLLHATAAMARGLKERPPGLRHQPQRYSTVTEPQWYWAAELVLQQQRPSSAEPGFVRLVALDAWRVDTLLSKGRAGAECPAASS